MLCFRVLFVIVCHQLCLFIPSSCSNLQNYYEIVCLRNDSFANLEMTGNISLLNNTLSNDINTTESTNTDDTDTDTDTDTESDVDSLITSETFTVSILEEYFFDFRVELCYIKVFLSRNDFAFAADSICELTFTMSANTTNPNFTVNEDLTMFYTVNVDAQHISLASVYHGDNGSEPLVDFLSLPTCNISFNATQQQSSIYSAMNNLYGETSNDTSFTEVIFEMYDQFTEIIETDYDLDTFNFSTILDNDEFSIFPTQLSILNYDALEIDIQSQSNDTNDTNSTYASSYSAFVLKVSDYNQSNGVNANTTTATDTATITALDNEYQYYAEFDDCVFGSQPLAVDDPIELYVVPFIRDFDNFVELIITVTIEQNCTEIIAVTTTVAPVIIECCDKKKKDYTYLIMILGGLFLILLVVICIFVVKTIKAKPIEVKKAKPRTFDNVFTDYGTHSRRQHKEMIEMQKEESLGLQDW